MLWCRLVSAGWSEACNYGKRSLEVPVVSSYLVSHLWKTASLPTIRICILHLRGCERRYLSGCCLFCTSTLVACLNHSVFFFELTHHWRHTLISIAQYQPSELPTYLLPILSPFLRCPFPARPPRPRPPLLELYVARPVINSVLLLSGSRKMCSCAEGLLFEWLASL